MKIEPLKQLWQLSFGDPPEAIDGFFATAYSPSRCQVLTQDGTVTAALYWLDAGYRGQKLAYLYAVATHPDFRGQGLCRRLMDQTHAVLLSQGYAGALLSPAGDGLRRMYQKMGYRDSCYCRSFTVRAAGNVPVTMVGIDEYARLRRQYLPQDGVIQEGENLSYLASYADLYAGADFLLAATRNGGTLQVLELLGNARQAPGITAALGCREGTFRTPGNETAIGMFRPLSPQASAPGYLGFVFD